MKKSRKQLIHGLLLTGAAAIAMPQAAMALTPACTQVNNRAFVNFKVGGVDQTEKGSTDGAGNLDTTFYVGLKVAFTVTKKDSTQPTTNPGASGATMTWTVTNNSNHTLGFNLTSANLATTTDNVFANGYKDTVSPTGNVTTAGTAGFSGSIASLAGGGTPQDITVAVDIPLSYANNDLAVWSLIAEAKSIGTGGATFTHNGTQTGTQLGVTAACTGAAAAKNIDTVLNEGTGSDDSGANDGKQSARDSLLVSAADLTVTKTQSVYWDPVNGYAPNAKLIPGAVVTYTVQVANGSGAATATNVKIADDLGTPIGAGSIEWGNKDSNQANSYFKNADKDCTGASKSSGMIVKIGAGSYSCLTDESADGGTPDGGSFSDAADTACGGSNKVCVSGLTVAGGETATIKYQVTITQ